MENSLRVKIDHKALVDRTKLIGWEIIHKKILCFLNTDGKISNSAILPIHLISHGISMYNATTTHTINKVYTIYKGH